MLPFTGAVLVALGALAQINPVWLFGPYQPGSISAGSVPDWYMGFLDGALRVMPAWELSFGGHPLSLDVLIPAVIVPGLFFTLVAAYPLLDGWIAGGRPPRGLLPPKPADPANRIGVGVAGITLYGLLWAAAANDEIAYHLQVSLYTVTWVFRILVLTGPVLAFALTRMICHVVKARRHDEAEHGIETGRIVMTPEGGFTEIREPAAPRLCPFGGADDGPGTEQDGGDRVVAGYREVRLPGRGQVVGQQPPGLLGVHGQARREAGAGLVTELPAGLGGHQVPGPGERSGNRDRHGVAGPCQRPGQAVGIGPAQPSSTGPARSARRSLGRPSAWRICCRWIQYSDSSRAWPSQAGTRSGAAQDTEAVRARTSSPANIALICGPAHAQQVGDQAGAEAAGGADPFGLQLIQPGHEVRLGPGGGGGAEMPVAVARQQLRGRHRPDESTAPGRSSPGTARDVPSAQPPGRPAARSAGRARRRTSRHSPRKPRRAAPVYHGRSLGD